MELVLLFTLLSFEHSFALGNFFGLPFISLLDVENFLIEHLLSRLLCLLRLEVKHGESHLISVFFDEICLDHLELLTLAIFYFVQDTIKIM